MFAKQQSDLLLLPRLATLPERGAYWLSIAASAASAPSRLDDLRITAIDCHSQKIPAVRGRHFDLKID